MDWRWQQEDVDRVQEFRKCIECFLCQDVCHVLRDHELKHQFVGPRFLVRIAGLEMHPLDGADRRRYLKDDGGIGLLQHHQVLHRGLPRGHPHHRQRDHPAEGARGRPPATTRWRPRGARSRAPAGDRPQRRSRPRAPVRRRSARGRETATADGLRLLIHTDGAARGNPGPAGAGAALRNVEDGSLMSALAVFLGERTNNYAEWTAVALALEEAKLLGASRVDLRTDSQLVTRQISGMYRVKHPDLKPIHAQVMGCCPASTATPLATCRAS